MPVFVEDFADKIRTVKAKWEDVEVNVQFNASKNTPELSMVIQEAQRDGDVPMALLLDHLIELMVGWDIFQRTNGDGNGEGEPVMWPITRPNLAKLPMAFLTDIIKQIGEQQNPTTKRPGRSNTI